ncbi:MAG TPA: hypothetical protein VIC06_07405 [Solirubrobacteraceae bacterium]|jgi:hypothetical protein
MTSKLHLPTTERRLRERARSGARRRRAEHQQPLAVLARPDIAARKVREAGGPMDMASYGCLCGFVFAAAVSTSVECPHCGAPQAW